MDSLADTLRKIWEQSLGPVESRRLSADSLGPTILSEEQSRELARKWQARLTLPSGYALLYESRLKSLGLDGDAAWSWLAGCKPANDQPLPTWVSLLRNVLQSTWFSRNESLGDGWWNYPAEEQDFYPQNPLTVPLFPKLLEPYVSWSIDRVRSSAPRGNFLDEKAVYSQLARQLLYRLSNLCARVLAYEVKRRSKRGELLGETPKERYCAFVASLSNPNEQLALFQAYPVLARLLAQTCERFIVNQTILLERTHNDLKGLLARFNAGRLRCLHVGLSDPHHGGQTVAILVFDCGTRLVYKPRSLLGDECFCDLVAWWNGLGIGETLRPAQIWNRGEYGWSEFISPADCNSAADVRAYFRRQGQWTALLYFLRATDFHAENFVACGDQPVPIDLEGLLAPWPGAVEARYWDVPPPFRPIGFSPYDTGMLPVWTAADSGQPAHAVSGLAGSGDRMWPSLTTEWRGLETDQLTPGLRHKPLRYDQSLPRWSGQLQRAEDHLDEIQTGFACLYRAVVRHRQELLAPGGPLDRLSQAPGRCVLRHTHIYKEILHRALYPDNLKGGAAHDVALEMLCRHPAPLEDAEGLDDREKAEMWQRDVPTYYGHPRQREIVDHRGVRVADVLSPPSYEIVSRRLQHADDEELAWMNELISVSLRTALRPEVRAQPVGSASDRLLDAAEQIAGGLDRLGLRTSRGVGWMHLYRADSVHKYVNLTHGGPYLYQGAAGVALFLANLAAASGDSRWARLAICGLNFAESMAAHTSWETYHQPCPPHGIDGPMSLAYALAEAGRLLNEPALLNRASRLALKLTVDPPPQIAPWDMANGVAGDVLVLLHLHRVTDEGQLLERAIDFGQRLIALTDSDIALLGMAHGLAGLGHVLGALQQQAPQAAIQDRLPRVCARLEAEFSTEHGEWPDLRYSREPFQYMTGWCGGAPGIGMAYLALSVKNIISPTATAIDRAVQATVENMSLASDHLCCGRAGRIWFLSAAGAYMRRPELEEIARTGAHEMLDKRQQNGTWDFGDLHEADSIPALFRGIAGIGLALLQVRDPGSVSQVLTLE